MYAECARYCALRSTIRKIADNEPGTMPATIEDPKVLEEIKEAMGRRGVV
ncbi:MAG: hypothetical protein WBD48_00780 [Pseudolabrys sp.]